MTTGKHIGQDELALYALQLLGPDESAGVVEHLKNCDPCRENVAAVQGDLVAYALTAEMHSPPAAARQRLMKAIGRERKVVPVSMAPLPEASSAHLAYRDAQTEAAQEPVWNSGRGSRVEEEEVPQKRRGWRIFPILGWAVAASMTAVAADLYHERELTRATLTGESVRMASLAAEAAKGQALMDTLTDENAMEVTLTQTPGGEKPKPVGHVTYAPDKGALIFTASNLEAPPPYKTYELWLIPANGQDPIPAGTFKPNARGDASVVMPHLPTGVVAKAFGVTLEDQGGSTQPTLPILLAGE